MEGSYIERWREVCPVAKAIERNGFKLDNYVGAKSGIVLREVEQVLTGPVCDIETHAVIKPKNASGFVDPDIQRSASGEFFVAGVTG